MQEIKGGAKPPFKRGTRTYQTKSTPVKYDPKDDVDASPTVKPGTAAPVQAMPKVIEVKQTPQLRSVIPGSVWKCGKFRWDPHAFGIESEKLNEKIIDSQVQDASLARFLEDPTMPAVYVVSGNPDDVQAKYFAAFLVQKYLEQKPHAQILWHQVFGGFDNQILREYDPIDGKSDPGLLVISNLTPNSTGVKLEKVRDLLVRFSEIPRIIVAAGEDPLSFATTRLYTEVNAIAYFSTSLVRKRIEVI